MLRVYREGAATPDGPRRSGVLECFAEGTSSEPERRSQRKAGWMGEVRKNSVCKKVDPESSKCACKGTVA